MHIRVEFEPPSEEQFRALVHEQISLLRGALARSNGDLMSEVYRIFEDVTATGTEEAIQRIANVAYGRITAASLVAVSLAQLAGQLTGTDPIEVLDDLEITMIPDPDKGHQA